jgi:hypothetical protein
MGPVVEPPLFLTVNWMAALPLPTATTPKSAIFGVMDASFGVARPVIDAVTTPPGEAEMVRVARFVPKDMGLKTIPTVQVALAGSGVRQPF